MHYADLLSQLQTFKQDLFIVNKYFFGYSEINLYESNRSYLTQLNLIWSYFNCSILFQL